MVAQKHMRAVSKLSFPLIDINNTCVWNVEFKPHVFEIHLKNQQVVFHWVSSSSAWPEWVIQLGFIKGPQTDFSSVAKEVKCYFR